MLQTILHLAQIILALSITRGELAPEARYTVTGTAYYASGASAKLVAPQGIVIQDSDTLPITDDTATLHWVIGVTPYTQRGIILPLTMVVNGKSYTIPIRVSGYSTYLPIVDRRGSNP